MNPSANRYIASGRLPIVLTLYVVVILAAGLWPLNFLAENRVSLSPGGNGLVFDGRGLAMSQNREGDSLMSTFTGKALTVELWVKPTAEPASGVPSLLAFFDAQSRKHFFVGQWKSHLIVRSMTDRPTKGNRSYREIGLREALTPGKGRFITITSDPTGTVVYLDGEAARAYEQYSVFCEACTVTQLVVGNSPTGKAGWTGVLLGLAILGRISICPTSWKTKRPTRTFTRSPRI